MMLSIIKSYFSFLVAKFGYVEKVFTDDEVYYQNGEFAILIAVDREGPMLLYVDIKSRLRYHLGFFLINKRGGELRYPSSDDFVKQCENGLKRDAQMLEDKGFDILNGNMKWKRDYGWNPLRIPDHVIDFLKCDTCSKPMQGSKV